MDLFLRLAVSVLRDSPVRGPIRSPSAAGPNVSRRLRVSSGLVQGGFVERGNRSWTLMSNMIKSSVLVVSPGRHREPESKPSDQNFMAPEQNQHRRPQVKLHLVKFLQWKQSDWCVQTLPPPPPPHFNLLQKKTWIFLIKCYFSFPACVRLYSCQRSAAFTLF